MKDKSKDSQRETSGLSRLLYLKGDVVKAKAAIRRAFIASVLMSSVTVLMLIIMSLMVAGGVPLPSFHYLYLIMIPVTIGISIGLYYESRIAALAALIFFSVDKILLMGLGVVGPIMALPGFLVLFYFFYQGIRGAMSYHLVSNKETPRIKEELPQAKSKNYEKFMDSLTLLLIVCMGGLVASKAYLWLSHLSWGAGTFGAGSWSIITKIVPGLFFGVIIIMLYKFIKTSIGTLQTAVTLVISMALAVSMSTLIPQHGTVPNQPLEYYPKAYGAYLGKIIVFLDMHSIFHSWWFIGMFVLLIGALIKVISTKKFNKRNIGFHVTHLSLIAILLSVWVNYFLSFNGIIQLRVGSMDNRVQLFPESVKKLGIKERELPFMVLLDRFETEHNESNFKLYLKKFPKKLPKTLSQKTYQRISKMLPPTMMKHVEDAYALQDKLMAPALLTVLSTAGTSYLSTYKKVGRHYVLKGSAKPSSVVMLKKIFKQMGYKGKDVTANIINAGQTEKVYTTNISYKVLNYYPHARLKQVSVPQKMSETIYQQILSEIKDKDRVGVLERAYEKAGTEYRLKPMGKDSFIYVVADALSQVDQGLLSDLVPPKKSALQLTFMQGKQKDNTQLMGQRSNKRHALYFTHRNAKLIYLWDARESDLIKEGMSGNIKASTHMLTFKREGKSLPELVVEPGKLYPLPGTSYKVKVINYYWDFTMDQASKKKSNASSLPKNPAIELELIGPSTNGKSGIPFTLFANHDSISLPGRKNAEKLTGLKFNYYLIRQKLFFSGKDKSFVHVRDGKVIQKSGLKYNSPVSLGGYPEILVYPRQIIPDVDVSVPVINNMDHAPDSFLKKQFEEDILPKVKDNKDKKVLTDAYQRKASGYGLRPDIMFNNKVISRVSAALKKAGYITPPSSPFVELEIMKDDKPVAVMGKKRIALSPNYSISTAVIPDSKYTLSLESRTEREVKAWKSHLRLLDLNNAPIEGAEKVIRVNDYLYYGGYRFYQTDAKREDPGYSGIGVSTEPGINYIYFFFTTLCAGIFLMFYIKPTRASNNDGE